MLFGPHLASNWSFLPESDSRLMRSQKVPNRWLYKKFKIKDCRVSKNAAYLAHMKFVRNRA